MLFVKLRVIEALGHRLLEYFDPVRGRSWRNKERRTGQPQITKHRQHFSLSLRLGEGFNIGQVTQAGILVSLRHFHQGMEINFVRRYPFGITHEMIVGGSESVELAGHESDIALRSRIAGDKLGIFERQNPSEEPADIVNGMADGLRTDAHAWG